MNSPTQYSPLPAAMANSYLDPFSHGSRGLVEIRWLPHKRKSMNNLQLPCFSRHQFLFMLIINKQYFVLNPFFNQCMHIQKISSVYSYRCSFNNRMVKQFTLFTIYTPRIVGALLINDLLKVTKVLRTKLNIDLFMQSISRSCLSP